jgi:hypothetical protein
LLLGEAASVLTAWQQAIVAAVFEFCLVGVMVIYELLGHAIQLAEERLGEASVRAPSQETPERTKVLQSRPRAKPATTKDNVGRFIQDQVFPAEGERTEIKTLMQGYRVWCSKQGLSPIGLTEFLGKLEVLCRKLGIKIEVGSDRRVYCLDVKVAATEDALTAVH